MPLVSDRSSTRRWVARFSLALLTATLLWLVAAGAGASRSRAATLPPIHHVWVIDLENNSFDYTFGKADPAPYLSKTLAKEGALLTHYYGIGHDSLDNYIAQISGQAPDYSTGQDCSTFSRFIQFGGENFEKFTQYGQLTGEGCVFPAYVPTVANQLTDAGLTWKAYEEDMGNDPRRDKTVMTSEGPACGHPKVGSVDLTDTEEPANDSYATRHDPFVYFHSIIDNAHYCDTHVLSIQPLVHDLASVKRTPNLSFVTPNTCHDAHDIPKCQNGEKGGLGQADRWLAKWVPRIKRSPAYADGGMIVITFDESGKDPEAAACCGEVDGLGLDDPSHPNVNDPGLYGPGGGRVGAVVLSPFVKPGTTSNQPYNHYSLLRTIEDVFGLPHIGDAQQPQVHSFGADVFTRP